MLGCLHFQRTYFGNFVLDRCGFFPSPMLAITHPISPAHRWTLFSWTCCTSSFIVLSPRVSSSSWMFQQMVCVQNLARLVRQVTSGFQRGAYLYDSTIPQLLFFFFFFFSRSSLRSLTFSPVFSEIRNYPLFRQVVGISKDSLCSKEKQQQNLHINLHSPTCHVFFFLVISSSVLENTVFSRNQKRDIGAPVTLASLEVLLCVL